MRARKKRHLSQVWQCASLLCVLALTVSHNNICPTCMLEVQTRSSVLAAEVEPSLRSQGEHVHTEALTLIGASEYHAAGILGAGVKVAVIDENFAGLADRIAEGELPADLITRRFIAGAGNLEVLEQNTGSHGVACAEIIHDIAPEAQLYLIQVDNLVNTLEAVIDYLREEGVRIVSISMSTLSPGRGDGTGLVAGSPIPIYALLDAARDSGILIIKSAGNYAQQHYQGEYLDTDGNGWHEFGRSRMGITDETLPVQLQQGKTVNITLIWGDWGNDPLHPIATSTFELFLFNAQGIEVARNAASRKGTDAPVQEITFTPNLDGNYAIRIRGSDPVTRSLSLEIFAVGEDVALTAYMTSESSLGLPGDATSVFTVGAVNATTERPVPYSSRGPTKDGRIKPDLSSYSFVSVASPDYGPRGFGGTSAAAPHVAGMAALLLSLPGQEAMSVSDLETRLLVSARDQGRPGADTLWGAGIAQLPPLGIFVQLPEPTQSIPGRLNDPRRYYIKVVVERTDGSPLRGLTAASFEAQIDGQPAPVVTARNLGSTYLLEVALPTYLRTDNHIVEVNVLGMSSRAETMIAIPENSSSIPTIPTLDVSLSNATPRPGEPVLFLASLAGHIAQNEMARVIASISHPTGTTDTIMLHDDGSHGDGLASDGIYGAWYARITTPGRYPTRVIALTSAHSLETAPPESQVELVLTAVAEPFDTDGDGMPDLWEQTFGTHSNITDAQKDLDHDGLSSLEEFLLGSDPLNWDSDGDGLTDGMEIRGYFVTSPINYDTDLGGAGDGVELQRGTNPLNSADDDRESVTTFLPLKLRPFTSRPRPRNHLSADGALWLATDSGVVRWNPETRSYVKHTSADGLAHDKVYAIQNDRAGNIWIGTQGGISRFDGMTWKNYSTVHGLPHPIVRALEPAPDGNLWAATAHGAAHFDGAQWRTTGETPVSNLYAVALDDNNRVWIGGEGGCAVLEGGEWQMLPALTDSWVTALESDTTGHMWVGTWGAGVAMFDATVPHTATWITHNDGLVDDFVESISLDEDGRIWVRTQDGISAFDGSGWTIFTSDTTIRRASRFEAPINEAVHRWFGTRPLNELPPTLALIMTAEKRPWFGATQRIQNNAGTWEHYQTSDLDPVSALALDTAGHLWAATGSSLSIFNGKDWAMLTTYEGLPNRRIVSLAADAAGTVWAGTDGAGVLRADTYGWTHLEVQHGLISSFIHAIAVEPEGDVWFGSGGGLNGISRLQPDIGAWMTMNRADVLGGKTIRAIVPNPGGGVWLGTEQSVARFADGTWTQPIATAAPVNAIAVDSRQQLWIGTDIGLAYLEAGTWVPLKTYADSEPPVIRDILTTPEGRLWCATASGVLMVDPHGDRWRSLTLTQGLLSNDVRHIVYDITGEFWVATNNGLSLWIPAAE